MGGATVYLNASLHDEDCHTYQLSAVADRNGEFAVGPVEEFRWIEFVYGDPVAGWTLCVDTPGGRKVLLTQGGIGRPGSKMDIQCDVSAAKVGRVAHFGGTIEEGNTCSIR
ncbi:hypothetical protein [Anaeromyxobacter oryzisoli]|uniref:hypothetical protein n=1 Tax=Anaeromyxobacter oryzisoli TaxID=2925408 RepID=UPI001F5A958D|nr:hypothetical protein [Anaeromyxobacter sp. SG63]